MRFIILASLLLTGCLVIDMDTNVTTEINTTTNVYVDVDVDADVGVDVPLDAGWEILEEKLGELLEQVQDTKISLEVLTPPDGGW